MEFFNKHKIVVLRSLGGLMLVIGFVIHFWTTPKEGFSANEKAAANVARMEAKVSGKNTKSTQKDTDSFLKELQEKQAAQLQYLTILAMLFGVGFLGYSFIPKKED